MQGGGVWCNDAQAGVSKMVVSEVATSGDCSEWARSEQGGGERSGCEHGVGERDCYELER